MLSVKAQKACDNWVSIADWHTNQQYDRERFYRFVHAVITYSRKSPISNEDLQALIKRKFKVVMTMPSSIDGRLIMAILY